MRLGNAEENNALKMACLDLRSRKNNNINNNYSLIVSEDLEMKLCRSAK